jgi:hypothetical protein
MIPRLLTTSLVSLKTTARIPQSALETVRSVECGLLLNRSHSVSLQRNQFFT